jgi:hypothetical protein
MPNCKVVTGQLQGILAYFNHVISITEDAITTTFGQLYSTE